MGNITGNPSSRYLVTQDNGNQYYTNGVGSRWGNTWEAHDVQGQAAYNQAARAGLVNPAMDATPVWQRDEMVVDQTEEPQESTVMVDTPEVVVETQKKNPTTFKKRNAAPANNGLGKYGFAGGVQRNWRGTRGAISDENLAKLKEMGFTGTTARDAQKWMNDNFSQNGMFGYKVATDNAWGNQSQKAFDQLYKSWQANQQIKPDELKSAEVEQPVDAPDFGYRSSGEYSLDRAKEWKNLGVKNWDTLVKHAQGNNDLKQLMSGYFGTDDVTKWDRNRFESDAKIGGGYHSQDRAQLQGFIAGLQKRNNDAYDAKKAAFEQSKFNVGNAGAGTLGDAGANTLNGEEPVGSSLFQQLKSDEAFKQWVLG